MSKAWANRWPGDSHHNSLTDTNTNDRIRATCESKSQSQSTHIQKTVDLTAGVDHVFVTGLATDYCVKFTELDARKLGFAVTLIEDGCRGVNLQPGDVDEAIDDMNAAGVMVVNSKSIIKQSQQ